MTLPMDNPLSGQRLLAPLPDLLVDQQHFVRTTGLLDARAIAAIKEACPALLVWADVWPLLIIAVLATPIGLAVFRRGERHAKKHGKLKRAG